MSVTFSKEIDPNRLQKRLFGLKAKTTVNRITLNPSSANPGEKVYEASSFVDFVLITTMKQFYRMKHSTATLNDKNNKAKHNRR